MTLLNDYSADQSGVELVLYSNVAALHQCPEQVQDTGSQVFNRSLDLT